MTKVALTGSEGTVGRILTGRSLVEGEQPQLQAEITRLDTQEDKGSTRHPFIQTDLEDREQIKQLLRTHDVLIHAAWNTKEGILRPDGHDSKNLEIAQRILECAAELGDELTTTKVVLLSSVNAHVPEDWRERREAGKLISPDEAPQPNRHNRNGRPGHGTTRYGQSKIAMEEAARQAANRGVHAIVLRLGGVNLRDRQSSTYEPHQKVHQDPGQGKHFDAGPGGWEDAVRLRHTDLVARMQQLVDAPNQPNTFELYNLVSDNPDKVHET
jgi:nucleoside-diphosphate-sugar epimerase